MRSRTRHRHFGRDRSLRSTLDDPRVSSRQDQPRAMLNDIVARISDDAARGGEARSARRIAGVIGRMITAGELAVGERLPTVRELATRLGVSPTTVSEAWHSLAAVGAI